LIQRVYQSLNSEKSEVLYSDEEIEECENLNVNEKEKFLLNTGGCFGDWAIIFKQKRSASAKIVEDCICILIDGTNFYNSFSKKILKYENERRKFLKKKITIFEEETNIYFDYFKRVKVYVRSICY